MTACQNKKMSIKLLVLDVFSVYPVTHAIHLGKN